MPCVKYNNDYYTDEELSDNEIERLEKYQEIKDFTLDDYFNCKETKHLLIDEWFMQFNCELEEYIKELFLDYLNDSQINYLNVMQNANEDHYIDLIELVKHNLVKDYNIGIFEENPGLAKPLLLQIKNELKERDNTSDYE